MDDTQEKRTGKYTLSCPAEELYDHLARDRQVVIDAARDMAEITIPSVFPPDGYKTGDVIAENNQSVGALCVNTLASKLMLMALPPDRPVLRFEPLEHRLRKELDQPGNEELWTSIQIALSRLEIEHRRRLEATSMRSAYVGAIKVLLIGGNVLWEHIKIDRPVYHLMTNYVCWRNAQGEPLGSILKRFVSWMDLDDDHKDIILGKRPELGKQREYERVVEVYAVCKRCGNPDDGFYWEYWEEFEGERLPDTEVETDYDKPPLYPAWLIPVYGQNWGRSYCEEYRGDLYAVENLASATNDGASAAALTLLFNKPGSRTSTKKITTAKNMEVLTGSAEDLSIFKLDKQGDFAFVENQQEKAIRRLGRAFLMVSSVQRQAERVTAEEWNLMAREIDEAMGGTYSELSQSFQVHTVRRFVALHNEEDKQLPKLPEGIFRVAVVTGIEAMGRSIEGEALVRALMTIEQLFKEEGIKRINITDAVRRILVSESIKQDGLVLTDEQIAQENQRQQMLMAQHTLLDKAAGPVAGGLAKAAPDMLMAAQQQQAGQPSGDTENAGEAPVAPPANA